MGDKYLEELADRCEHYVASGRYDFDRDAERELNEAIGLAAGVKHRRKVGDPALGNDRWVPLPSKPYVTSIDAAMTLVPENLSFEVRRSGTGDKGQATIWNPMKAPTAEEWRVTGCSNPALALCAAALRAHAACRSPATRTDEVRYG